MVYFIIVNKRTIKDKPRNEKPHLCSFFIISDAQEQLQAVFSTQDIANNPGNLARPFKVADIALEVGSWVLAGMSSSLAISVLSLILGLILTPLTLTIAMVFVYIMVALIAVKIDDKAAEKFNDIVLPSAN